MLFLILGCEQNWVSVDKLGMQLIRLGKARPLATLWLTLMLLLVVAMSVLPVDDWVNAIDKQCLVGCAPGSSGTAFHLLGTDNLGRDVLAQLLGGARTALLGGLVAAALSLLLGFGLGSLAAWASRGGRGLRLSSWALLVLVPLIFYFEFAFGNSASVIPWLLLIGLSGLWSVGKLRRRLRPTAQRVLLFVAEVMNSVPALLLFLALAAMAFRPGLWQLVLIYVFVRWTKFATLTVYEVESLLEEPFIEAAYQTGISKFRLFTRHLLPNAWSAIGVEVLLTVIGFILVEGTFSFLGIGLPPEQASWGRLIAQSREIGAGWWLWLFPGAALVCTILSIHAIAKTLRGAKAVGQLDGN